MQKYLSAFRNQCYVADSQKARTAAERKSGTWTPRQLAAQRRGFGPKAGRESAAPASIKFS
jgi:hypothetical protein